MRGGANGSKDPLAEELGEESHELRRLQVRLQEGPRNEPPIGQERCRECQLRRQMVRDPIDEQESAPTTPWHVGQPARLVPEEA
jgi:hypothetical protein